METTVKKLDSSSERKYWYDGYEIYIEDHRILTVSTLCPTTASKWIEEVHTSHRNQPGPFLVGICVDRRNFTVGRGVTSTLPTSSSNFAMAVEGPRRDDLDLGRYHLDRLAKVVLGQEMYVIRPRQKVKWFDTQNQSPYWNDQVLSKEKVKFSTLDSYFCFLIGSKLLDLIDRAPSYSSSSWSLVVKRKKNKKKIKKKNKNKRL